MHTYNIDLIRKIYDLKSELSPKSSYSYSFLDKNTKKGEKVWIKFYNGDEMQNQQFLLEVAENSPGNCTHIQTIVGNDGKTYNYPISELENADNEPDRVVEVCIDDTDFSSRIGKKKIKPLGTANLKNITPFFTRTYDLIDISEVSFFIEDEERTPSYGWGHSGPVYGKTRTHKVDVLQRFISKIKAKTLILPDDVMRRHINEAKKSKHIKQLLVRDTCKLFANENGKLMNKKKTSVVFGYDFIET